MNVSNGVNNQGSGQNPNLDKQNQNGYNQQSQGYNQQQQNYNQQSQGYNQQQQGYYNQQNYNQQQQQNYNQQSQGYNQQQQGYYNQQNYNQQQQQNYAQQQNYYQAQPVQPMMPPRSTVGLVGLILSIISLICCGPVLAIPGIICSIVGMLKTRGDKRAVAGLIVGFVSILLWVVLWFTGIVSLNKLTVTDKYGNTKDYLNDDTGDIDDYDGEVDNGNDGNGNDNADLGSGDNDDNTSTNNNSGTKDVLNTKYGNDPAPTEFNPASAVFNGVTLTTEKMSPADVEEALGIEFNSDDLDFVVNPGYYEYITYYADEEHNDIIYFYFYNNKEDAVPMRNCTLYKIEFSTSGYFDGHVLSDWANIELGGGINEQSTADDIITLLGEPEYEYKSDEYNVYEIEYTEKFDYNYKVSFGFSDGKLYEIRVGQF